jgi:hypothetical protein
MDSGVSEEIGPAWERFRSRLKIYGKGLAMLQGPAPAEDVGRAEAELGFPLPGALRDILAINNGQVQDSPGVFKSLSGWDVYRRHMFLDAAAVAGAYLELVGDESCRRLLGEDEIPFGVNGTARFGAILSIHRVTGAVSLLRNDSLDWTLPEDWVIVRKPWAPTLASFLDDQVSSYR